MFSIVDKNKGTNPFSIGFVPFQGYFLLIS